MTAVREHRRPPLGCGTFAANTPRPDPVRVRADFPILSRSINGKPLVYLDSAATSQKPRAVIDAVRHFYEAENSNIHRGVYQLSAEATARYDDARATVASFLHARHPHEVIFTRGTTESINLVARSFLRPRLHAGDEIVVTELEHHSNIVPWQLVAAEAGAVLRPAPINEDHALDLDAFERLLSDRTKMVAITGVSNAIGVHVPLPAVIRLAHQRGIPVLVDGAQMVPHGWVDVAELDCDFFACSGHKMFGPTGIGVLYGRESLLEAMEPYQGGGDMIDTVTFERSTWAPLPAKFEAGTPNIAGAVGLAAAIRYLDSLAESPVQDNGTPYPRGFSTTAEGIRHGIGYHDSELVEFATSRLIEDFPEITIFGEATWRTGVVSFALDGVHPHDIGTVLDNDGICIRAGHHCAQPLMRRLGVPATARASFALYNTQDDVEALIRGLHRVKEIFG